MPTTPSNRPEAAGSRWPGRLSSLALVLAGVLIWPGLLGRFVSLDWQLGDMRGWAFLFSVSLLAGGAVAFACRRRIDTLWARVFPSPRQIGLAAMALSLALLFGLGLAELGLRLFHYPFRLGWTPMEYRISRFDPELGWTYLPGLATTQQFGSAGREVPIYFDDIGSRVPTAGTRRDPRAPTAIFVGCSYTFGHGVPYEETFAGRLAAQPGFPFQVVNLGVQGYGTDQALLILKRYFHRFNTKVVVYTFLLDHVKRNENSDRRFLFPKARFPGTKPRFALDADGALFQSSRPERYEERIDWHLRDLIELFWTKWGPSPSLEVTRALIREMQRYVEANGAELVVVLWTNRHSTADPDLAGALFQGIRLNTVDTGAGAPTGWNSWIIPGEVHPDARAHAYVADRLTQEFQRLELMPSGQPDRRTP